MNSTVVKDANIVAAYLAQDASTPIIDAASGPTAIALVGSAILPTTRAVFDFLTDIDVVKASPMTLVLCGGIGHSTPLLRTAICTAYPSIKLAEVEELPEARIFEKVMRTGWPKLCERIDRGEIGLLVEEQSTNCGANATLVVDLMSTHAVTAERLVVVQDPTMMRRTIASFEKAYVTLNVNADSSASTRPQIIPWATFTPRLRVDTEGIKWEIVNFSDRSASVAEIWTMDRFLELITGEIARLYDDSEGYGPKGKGYIGHVDIPEDVLQSWKRLKKIGGGRLAHP